MQTGTAHNGEIRLAYDIFGDRDGAPLLLIAGAALPRFGWPDEFCIALTERGFAVARFDNRDAGESTHLPADAKYTLADLTADTAAVLDELNWPSAHLFGSSLGGMIGQFMATHQPERVRSLTSASSAPCVRLRVSRPRIRTLLALIALNRKPRTTPEAAVDYFIELFRITGSAAYPADEQWVREFALRCFEHGDDAGAFQRQWAAARSAGDRRAELATVAVPTLILHGEADPMQSVRAGRATADAIPGARLVTYPGLGHALPRELWPSVIDEVCNLVTSRPGPASRDHKSTMDR